MKTYFGESFEVYYNCLGSIKYSHNVLSNHVDVKTRVNDFRGPEVECYENHSCSISRKENHVLSSKINFPKEFQRSPARVKPMRSSPGVNYIPINSPKSPAFAGSKFGSSPTPKSLPPPPSHWISSNCHPPQPCHEVAQHIKMLLQMV